MESMTKKCPMCAEEILQEAQVCRYCGAKFEVIARGYCSYCHELEEADQGGHCLKCNHEVIDLHIESNLINEEKPRYTPAIDPLPLPMPSSTNAGVRKRLRMLLAQNYVMPQICTACGHPAGATTMRAETSRTSRMGKLQQTIRLEFPLCDDCGEVNGKASQFNRIGCLSFLLVLGSVIAAIFIENASSLLIGFAVVSFLAASFLPMFLRSLQPKMFRDTYRLVKRAAILSNYQPPTLFRSTGYFDLTLNNQSFAQLFASVNTMTVQDVKNVNAPNPTVVKGCGIIFGILGLFALIGFIGSQNENDKLSNSLDVMDESAMVSENRLAKETNTPSITSTPIFTATPEPTITPISPYLPMTKNGACFNSREFGISCMSDSGWNTEFQQHALGETIYASAVCPNDSLLLASYDEVWQWKSGQWISRGMGAVGTIQSVVCGDDLSIWVTGAEAVSRLTEEGWQDIPISFIQVGESNYKGALQAVVDGTGRLWVVTEHSIALRDNELWTVFKEGDPLDKEYDFVSIALDSNDQPWAAHSSGLLHYDGDRWVRISFSNTHTINDLLIDANDQVWIGTTNGLYRYENGNWVPYSVASGKTSKNVLAVEMDGQGRLWAGTTWGLAVLSGNKWTVYHMNTSDLKTNRVEDILVWGEGPGLPENKSLENGSVSGRILLNGSGLVKEKVEICVEYLGMFFTGTTPCSGQPLVLSSTTDNEGYFNFADVPSGCYSLIFQMPTGDWKVLSETFRLGSKQFCVSPGDNYQVKTLEAKE